MSKDLKIYCDGGARGNPGPAASAFVVLNLKNKVVREESQLIGRTTNNVAEYKALLMALKWLVESSGSLQQSEVLIYLDSELVTKQLTGAYKIKASNLVGLAIKVRSLESKIKQKIVYKHIRREANSLADSLVNKKLDSRSRG